MSTLPPGKRVTCQGKWIKPELSTEDEYEKTKKLYPHFGKAVIFSQGPKSVCVTNCV